VRVLAVEGRAANVDAAATRRARLTSRSGIDLGRGRTTTPDPHVATQRSANPCRGWASMPPPTSKPCRSRRCSLGRRGRGRRSRCRPSRRVGALRRAVGDEPAIRQTARPGGEVGGSFGPLTARRAVIDVASARNISADPRSGPQHRTSRQNDAWAAGQHAQNGTSVLVSLCARNTGCVRAERCGSGVVMCVIWRLALSSSRRRLVRLLVSSRLPGPNSGVVFGRVECPSRRAWLGGEALGRQAD